jgi:hypothetical protein
LRLLRDRARAPEAQLAVPLLLMLCAGALGGPALHGFYYTTWAALAVALAVPMLPSPRVPSAVAIAEAPRPPVGTPPARAPRASVR